MHNEGVSKTPPLKERMEKMKKFTKYAIALATVVALGGTATLAMADTTSNNTNTQAQQDAHHKGFGKGKEQRGFAQAGLEQNTELQTLLKLSADELKAQLQAGKTLADIASAQGVDKQAVIDLLVKQENARIDQEATQRKASSEQRVTNQVEGKGGFGGPGGQGHPGGRGGFAFAQNTDLQSLLKLSADELSTQLKAGKTLADIASAQGIDKQAVIDLLVKQDTARLDQAVTDGKLTSDQAEKMKTDAVQRTTDLVDGKGFMGGRGNFGGTGGFHGRRGENHGGPQAPQGQGSNQDQQPQAPADVQP